MNLGWTGVDVPRVGIGTWQMESDDRASAIAAVQRAIALGLTHVDTAELYGGGRVEEEIVAPAIAGKRDGIFLVSKVMPTNASRAGTIAACEKSLARLRTDRLDLYLLHWAGPHPLEETIAAFEQLVKQGKIRFWGVSNFDDRQMAEAAKIAGPKRMACNQVLHHLQQRAIEHAVIPWARKHDVAIVGYSPFGSRGGFPKPKSEGGVVLAGIAEEHAVSPRAVALAFLLEHATHVIPKSANAAHVDDFAAAQDLVLAKSELAAIDAAFPRGRKPRELPSI